MKITQVFVSAEDGKQVGSIEISNFSGFALVPATGDRVEWVAGGRKHSGKISSRLVSYSGPEPTVARADDFEIRVVLNVELEEIAGRASAD
jgi:hypothetical protein